VWIEKAKERKKMGCGGLSCEEKGTAWAGTRPFFLLYLLFYFINITSPNIVIKGTTLNV
jgi:hypothetical protein